MTLREARCIFTKCDAELTLWAFSQGFEVANAEGMDRITDKDPTTDHMKGGLHGIGLAQDKDLYKNGVYLTKSEDHAPLGARWKVMGQLYGLALAWGGDFKDKDGKPKPDGNHYSLQWLGQK